MKSESNPPNPRFATTRWSVVLAAADHRTDAQSHEALAALCASYWYPLYAYMRRRGYAADAAQDLTQDFFVRCIEKDYLRSVEKEKGRFRSFLLAALNHFLSDERDRMRAAKRGGGRRLVSLDELTNAEKRYRLEPAKGLTAEQIFERRWALTVLDRVLERLREEYAHAGKTAQFERLKGWLAQEPGDSHARAADDLGMTEGAVRTAAHRMKRRYAELLEAEIADTLEAGGDVHAELSALFAALGTA